MLGPPRKQNLYSKQSLRVVATYTSHCRNLAQTQHAKDLRPTSAYTSSRVHLTNVQGHSTFEDTESF